MKSNYILVAQGSIGLPIVNHMIFTESNEEAKAEGSKMSQALFTAGYYLFTLYDVRSENHVQVAAFGVEQPKPVVTIK